MLARRFSLSISVTSSAKDKKIINTSLNVVRVTRVPKKDFYQQKQFLYSDDIYSF